MTPCPAMTVHPSRFMEMVRWCRQEVGVLDIHWRTEPARANAAYTGGLDGWQFFFRDDADAMLFFLKWNGATHLPPDTL